MEEKEINNSINSPFLNSSINYNNNEFDNFNPKEKSNNINNISNDTFDNNLNINDNFNRKTMNPIYNIASNKDTLFNSRKTYNLNNNEKKETLFKKRITEFLLKKKKNKRKRDGLANDLINILYDEEVEESDEEDDSSEENSYHRKESGTKLKNFVNTLIKTKKSKEWDEYMDTYKKRVKESQSLRYKLKTIFHINSDFIVIWKTTLRIFHIFILFIFLVKYVFVTLSKSDSSFIIPKRILLLYNMINIMFIIDLFFSLLIIIFNGASKLTYFKLPLKIYTCIPFELKAENFYYLLPKFIRIDIFQKIFSSWERYINLKVELYVHKYELKIIITCVTQMVKYLLIFGLYAHINCCILSYFDDLNYPSSLFYTIEAFTVIGFGEQSPKTKYSVILVILNLFVGVNLFSLMTSNIKELSNKINNFNRDTSFYENYESFLFQIQKSIGRIIPSKVEQLMVSFLLFRQGLSTHDIKEEYKDIISSCKNNLLDEIKRQILEFLKLEYQHYFLKKSNNDFMYEIFENLKPKIFKANQVLIKYGQKVNKLYFLLNGHIYVSDYKNKPIYAMIDNAIFGDYEFVTNTLSCFNVKIDPKNPAYGFVLDKNSWEQISKRYIEDANYLIKQIIKKRKKHIQWTINKVSVLFDALPNIKEVKEVEEKEDIKITKSNDNIENIFTSINNNDNKNNINIKDGNIINNEKQEKERKRKMYNLKTAILEKNPKYNYSNINIIKNIDELHREINKFEFSFIDDKESFLNNLKDNYL